MKERITSILLTIMVFSLLLSCTIDTDKTGKTGTLVLNFPMLQSRTLIPGIDMTPASYDINGTGPNGATFSTTSDQPTVEITALDFGEWTVTADARNADNIIIGHGEATCTVHVGETTAVIITVTPLEGYGTVDLTVNWNAGDTEYPSIEAQLLPASGSPIYLIFTITGGNTATCAQNNIPTGFYTLTVKLLDGNSSNITPILTMGAVEIIRIIKDETTCGTFDFTRINRPGGIIQVTIDSQLADPLTVELSGQQDQITEGGSMTVTASVLEDVGNVTCVWYLNSETQATGESYTVSGLALGVYRLDVTAFSMDGKRAGSVTHNFSIVESSVIIFPDPNLEAAIRSKIGKPTGDIYLSDVENITRLDAGSQNITDLSGIENLMSLTNLYLYDNKISDLTPLSGLTSLTWLILDANQISDLTPLSGLTPLTDLYLGENQISDLTPLSGLTSLTYLDLFNNQISELTPLSGLTSLTNLNLYHNQISDLTPLSGLTSLRGLILNDNQISELTPLSGLTSLISLYLVNNQIVQAERDALTAALPNCDIFF